MLLNPLDPTESAIIDLLTDSPGKTAKELRGALESRGISIPQPTFYRVLSKLMDAKILVKASKQYSLNLVWVHTVQNLAERMQKTYIEEQEAVFPLPKEGKQITITENSLTELDRQWDHLILEMIHAQDHADWYEYQSHLWYALGMPESDIDLYTLLKKHEIRSYLLCGNKTYLDSYGVHIIQKASGTEENIPLLEDPPFPKEGYILILYGDYIMEFFMPEILTEHFKIYFDHTESIDAFDAKLFADIFRMKVPCTLKVRNDAQRAEELRGRFQTHF